MKFLNGEQLIKTKYGNLCGMHLQQQNQHNLDDNSLLRKRLESQKSEIMLKDEDCVHSNSVLLAMAGILLSSYLLASGAVQICFGVLNWSICDVNLSSDYPSKEAWLTAGCVVIGCLRILQFVPYARPVFDPRLHASPKRHPQMSRMLRPLTSSSDVAAANYDIGVINKTQLCAGILCPGFFYRTVLVAWHEGLIAIMGIAMHVTRVYFITLRFTAESHQQLLMLDQKLHDLFLPLSDASQPYSLHHIAQLAKSGKIDTVNGTIALLASHEIVHRLAHHNCLLFSSYASIFFWFEDVGFICLIVLLMMSSILFSCIKFQVYQRYEEQQEEQK